MFVIEANPRASRTVPFVSKATGVPLAKVAARVDGRRDARRARAPKGCCARRPKAATSSVKEAVLPFNRFPDVDTLLGPEMRSTGEVMGIDRTFGMAFAKSQAGAGNTLPQQGHGVPLARRPRQGRTGSSRPAASPSSASRSRRPPAPPTCSRQPASRSTRSWPRSARQVGVDAVDLISSGKVDLIVNTPRGRGPRADGMHIRRAAIVHGVACVTTVAAAIAAAAGIAEAVEPRARGALAAGVPPRRPAAARGVSARAAARSRRARGAAVDLTVDVGPVRVAEPDRRRVGHVRSRRRGRARCAIRASSARSRRSRSPRSRGPATRRCASPRRRAAAC